MCGKDWIKEPAGREIRRQVRAQILELAEPSYRQFSSKLLPGTERIAGVRLPLLRKLVKRQLKNDWRAYLEEVLEPLGSLDLLESGGPKPGNRADNESGLAEGQSEDDKELFEEVMFQGMLIGYAPLSLTERLSYLDRFLPKIDNWSVCDSVCSTMKFAKEYPQETWDFLQKYIHGGEEYGIRFAVVMYIDYFIREDYLRQVLRELDGIRHPAYYVKMAVAWAVSMCYVFNMEETEAFLDTCSLDDFTYNKSIQKIIESRRVGSREKEKLKIRKDKRTRY